MVKILIDDVEYEVDTVEEAQRFLWVFLEGGIEFKVQIFIEKD